MAEINEKQKAWRRLPTDEEWQRIWKDYPECQEPEKSDERAPRK